MAIDSRFKRFNIMAMANGGVLHIPVFEADGSVDADDRAHLLGRFGGNAFDAPAAASTSRFGSWSQRPWVPTHRTRRRR